MLGLLMLIHTDHYVTFIVYNSLQVLNEVKFQPLVVSLGALLYGTSAWDAGFIGSPCFTSFHKESVVVGYSIPSVRM